MSLSPIRKRYAMICIAVCIIGSGCERGSDASASPTPAPSPESKHVLIFDDDVRVKDESVNTFIEKAIDVCATGDYEGFRLLWSIQQNPPFTKQEFTMALQGGATVTIQRVQKFRTPEGEVVYAVRGRVELKQPGIPKPVRDIVLMLVNESDSWRLAVAPSYVRKAIERAEDAENEKEDSTEAPPPSDP